MNMKNKTITLLLAMSLSISLLTGCGSSNSTPTSSSANEATNQEASTTIESEEESETPTDIDNGDVVIYGIIDDGNYYVFSEMEFDEVEDITITSLDDLPLYDEAGRKVGYLKTNSTIAAIEENVDKSGWFKCANPIEEIDFAYLYVVPTDIANGLGTTSELYTFEEYLEALDACLEQDYQDTYKLYTDNGNNNVPSKTIIKDSPDGLELKGTIAFTLYKDGDPNDPDDYVTLQSLATSYAYKYEEIYLELDSFHYGSMTYNLYGKER
jgi:FlaG/FlaF family flagellin (archaellin)